MKNQKYNWKFVSKGRIKKQIMYMFCLGDNLVKEFSAKTCKGLHLEYALMFEKEFDGVIDGLSIRYFILKQNENAANGLTHELEILTDIDFKKLQKGAKT